MKIFDKLRLIQDFIIIQKMNKLYIFSRLLKSLYCKNQMFFNTDRQTI